MSSWWPLSLVFFGYNRAAYVKMSSVYSKQSTRLGCHASHRLGSSVFGSAFGFGSRGAIRDAVVSATTACFEKCGTKIMVQMENPKKLGSKAWDRFEKYKHARSIGEATQAGANWQDVSVDFEKGWKGLSESDGFHRWRYAPLYQTVSARRNTRSGIASACVYQGASFTDDATSSCSWSARPRQQSRNERSHNSFANDDARGICQRHGWHGNTLVWKDWRSFAGRESRNWTGTWSPTTIGGKGASTGGTTPCGQDAQPCWRWSGQISGGDWWFCRWRARTSWRDGPWLVGTCWWFHGRGNCWCQFQYCPCNIWLPNASVKICPQSAQASNTDVQQTLGSWEPLQEREGPLQDFEQSKEIYDWVGWAFAKRCCCKLQNVPCDHQGEWETYSNGQCVRGFGGGMVEW